MVLLISDKKAISKGLLILSGLGIIGAVAIASAVILAPSYKVSPIFEAANNGSADGYETRRILERSMLPTLHKKDLLLVDKTYYDRTSPQRGDIILFEPVDELKKIDYKEPFVQRLIGLPGETIEVKNDKVYIDGQAIKEDYILEAPEYNIKLTKIPSGSYFMLGDSRNNSHDSLFWGALPQELIIGKVVSIYFPPSRVREFD